MAKKASSKKSAQIVEEPVEETKPKIDTIKKDTQKKEATAKKIKKDTTILYSPTESIQTGIKYDLLYTMEVETATTDNFNISGGSERVKYFASLGVFTQDGLFKTLTR